MGRARGPAAPLPRICPSCSACPRWSGCRDRASTRVDDPQGHVDTFGDLPKPADSTDGSTSQGQLHDRMTGDQPGLVVRRAGPPDVIRNDHRVPVRGSPARIEPGTAPALPPASQQSWCRASGRRPWIPLLREVFGDGEASGKGAAAGSTAPDQTVTPVTLGNCLLNERDCWTIRVGIVLVHLEDRVLQQAHLHHLRRSDPGGHRMDREPLQLTPPGQVPPVAFERQYAIAAREAACPDVHDEGSTTRGVAQSGSCSGVNGVR